MLVVQNTQSNSHELEERKQFETLNAFIDNFEPQNINKIGIMFQIPEDRSIILKTGLKNF